MKAYKKIKIAGHIFAHLKFNEMLEKSKSETLDLLNANFEKYFKDNKAYKPS